MSTTTDTYTLKLVDQILAPLRKIADQADKVHESMGRLEKLASGGVGMLKLGGAIGLAVGALSLLKDAMGGVLDMMLKAGEGAIGFGKAVIDAMQFRERYRGLLQHQLGDKEGARSYKRIMDVSQLTPGTAQESMQNASQLINIGMRGNMLDAAFAGSMDVQAMYGTVSAEKFTRGISDMFSAAKLEEQDFKQAMKGIVPVELAQAAILRLKGIHVEAGKVASKFDELKKAGKISGKEGAIGSLMALEQHVTKGGGLGSYADKRGIGSIEGLMSNLMEGPQNLLRTMELEKSPALNGVKDLLSRLLKFFDAATPQGKQLVAVIDRMINALFGGLGRLTDIDLARFFESALKMAERLAFVIEDVWRVMEKLIHGDTSAFRESLATLMLDVGRLVGQGILEALKLGGKTVLKAAGGGLLDAMKEIGKAVSNPVAATGKVALKAAALNAEAFGWEGGRKALSKAGDTVGALNPVSAFQWMGRQDDITATGGWTEARDIEAYKQKRLGARFGRSNNGRIWDEDQNLEATARGMQQAGADLAKGAETGLRREAKSHSPSETMAEAGEDLVDGLVMGLRRRAAHIRDGSSPDTDSMLDALLEALRGVANRTGAIPT